MINTKLKLLKYDTKLKKELMQSKKDIIINNKEELKRYINEAFYNVNINKNLHLGIIPKETIIRIKKEIKNIKTYKIDLILNENINYDLVISYDAIRHIKKESLSKDDVIEFILIIDKLILYFDSVSYMIYAKKQHALRIKKEINNYTYILLKIISNTKKRLNTCTLFLFKSEFINKKRSLSSTFNEYTP